MAINLGDSVGGGTVGSVLFVGAGTLLAQNNFGFFYDAATNTLKSRNQTNSDSGSFGIGTGDVAGSSTGGSGALTIETGDGSPNTSGTDSAGNSGAATVATGAGGNGDNGSLAGNSGNLNLKTGSGGGNAFSGFSGGSAGNIILQPGSGGSGPAGQGVGGSTLVRASNSGDILAVQNSAGTTTHMGVANNGNVRIGTGSSAALLQLGAGTATLPPLKLTPGTLLNTPAAGAIEWDGSKLYITSGSIRRPLGTSLEVANVLDFGAKGDGTDDWTAIRDTVASLVETGGVVYLPPDRIYGIGSTVLIQSRLPIYVVSRMGWPYSLANSTANAAGYIKPLANLADGFFKWDTPACGHAARGGAIGLTFLDDRTYDVHSCLNLSNFIHGVIQDCNFWNIKGRAIYCDLASNWHAYRCQTRHCGDDNKPAWQLGDTTGSCYCHILRCFFEQNQDADVVRIPGQGSLGSNGVSFTDCGFEQETNDKPEQVQTFINGIGGVGWIRGCTFGRNNATQVILNYPFADVSHNTFTQSAGTVPALQLAVTAYQSKIFDNQYNGAAGAGRAFEIAASNCIISGNTMHAGGTIYSAGGYNIISGNKVISCKAAESATVLAQIESVGGHNNVIEGNIIDGEGTATLRGIFSAGDESVVAGNIVTRLDNATGIQTNGSRGTVTGNICTSLGGGQAFYISLPDNVVENNYPRTLNRNNGGVATTLTIAAGVININSSGAYGGSFKIDTEGAAASDDLDTINGGTEGDVIYLRAANDARTVVLKHGTGNLQVGLNVDFSLNSQYDLAIAYYTGAKWIVTGVNAGT